MRERFRMCEVPLTALIFLLHAAVSLMPSRTTRFSSNWMLQQCCAVMAQRFEAEPSGFT
jgi:hypothetical protein